MHVANVRFEHHDEPLGISEDRPRLTWGIDAVTLASTGEQTAYEIEIRRADGSTSTHRADSADRVLVAWPAAPLASRERREVRVRVWEAGESQPGPYSDYAAIEAGLLDPSDWQATAISPACDDPAAADPRPAYLLRDDFHLSQPAARARLYVTALGLCDIEINGCPATDDVLLPGWTSYHDRLNYRTYDVTHLLAEGDNAWGAHLADGWYRGRLGFNGGIRDIYGERTALFAQLEVTHPDGTVTTLTTSPDWRSAPGPILSTGLLEGETHDARTAPAGWSQSGFDDTDWSGIHPVDLDTTLLTAPTEPPVRRIEELAPRSITVTPSGKTLVDFGQNLVGRLRLRVRGQAGQTITLRHAEVIEDGELCTRPLRGAHATDQYILSGAPDGEEWEPRFTYHGFRYAEVTGWPGELTPSHLTAVVLHTDMRPTGSFTSSDASLNQLHRNITWSMRGNFVDIPTDCPQRDERLGWTGDLQVFAPTAAYLYDCAGVIDAWLRDLSADTDRDKGGVTPNWAPQIPVNLPFEVPEGNHPMAGWGDAAVLVPWTLYQAYGDLELLRRQYPDMRRWVDNVDNAAGPDHIWADTFQFGDWLDPTAPADNAGESKTPKPLVSTAYFARSTYVMAEAAALLGHTEDHHRYTRLATDIRAAFTSAFLEPSGRLAGDTQTAYALALCFNLLPDEKTRTAAGDRLAELVAEGGYTIATGFLGTPLVCDALTSTSHTDTAYRLLLERSCPSWLYQVDMGATTVWERWDSMLPDGTVNPGEMTSFNHYALGAVADWIHRTVGGLAPTAPGYRHILVKPRPGGGLTWARTEHRTPYGTAAVAWRIEDDQLIVDITIPPGTQALIDLPGIEPRTVTAGTHQFTGSPS
ncbi:alpha-L-rhamnosidase [Streptomyces maremycinicus]|nr:alpha-L-rhamnosidase [Streptomyces sp. B9173]